MDLSPFSNLGYEYGNWADLGRGQGKRMLKILERDRKTKIILRDHNRQRIEDNRIIGKNELQMLVQILPEHCRLKGHLFRFGLVDSEYVDCSATLRKP